MMFNVQWGAITRPVLCQFFSYEY